MTPQESTNDKIAKLLAKAERTDNAHEAEAYSKMAERLMLKWGIEEAVIRSRMDDGAKPEKVVTKGIVFPKLFIKARMSVAVAVIKGMGSMKCYVSGTTLMIMGFESDVDRALTLIPSVLIQADNAQSSWWHTYDIKHEMKESERFRARRQFLFSFAYTVQERLKAMRVEEVTAAGPGTDIVLYDRSKLVDEQFNKMTLRKGRNVKGSNHGAAEGRSAGQRASLDGKGLGGGARGSLGS